MTFKRGIILSGKKLYLVGIFIIFLLSLSACVKQDSALTLPISSKTPAHTTDTWSTSFENKEDKFNFLKEYQYLDLSEPMAPLPFFEYEVPGFDQYKELVAEQLGYDVNREEGALNVVKAGFWTYMADYDDVLQEYLRRWREFRGNWYKDNDISSEVLLPTEAERHKHKSDDTLEVKTAYAELMFFRPMTTRKMFLKRTILRKKALPGYWND